MDIVKSLNISEDLVQTHLIHKLAKRLCSNEILLDDFPPIFLQSKSRVVNSIFASRLAKHVTGTLTGTLTGTHDMIPLDEEIPFIKGNTLCFQIDICNSNIHDCVAFIKSTCTQKSMIGSRHVVILNIVDALKRNPSLAIKSIIEFFSFNAFFIVSSCGCFVDARIRNMCTLVNLEFDIRKLIGEQNESIIKQSEGDPVNAMLLLHVDRLGDPCSLAAFVRKYITNLEKIQKIQNGNMLEYSKVLREFCIRLGAACVPIHVVAKEILKIYDSYDIISLLAEMEHCCVTTSKNLFALQYYIDLIIRTKNEKQAIRIIQ